jgi:hypothetical protein
VPPLVQVHLPTYVVLLALATLGALALARCSCGGDHAVRSDE